MQTLEKITQRREQVAPVVENAMGKFLGVTINQINEDISNKLIKGNIDFDVDVTVSFKKAKEQFKKEFLLRLLQHTNGNISETARIAGVDRRSIHRLIHRFKIGVEKLRDQPYYFEEDKKNMYVKAVVEGTLKEYDQIADKYQNVDEDTVKNISKKLPEIRLTFEEAVDLFEKEFIKKALKRYKSEKIAAKKVGIRYETLHKKAKEHGLI